MNSSLSDYNLIEIELETEYDGLDNNRILLEEGKSDGLIEDDDLESDDYTYELID